MEGSLALAEQGMSIFDFDDCYQTLLNQLPAMGVDMVIDDDNNLQVNVKEVV